MYRFIFKPIEYKNNKCTKNTIYLKSMSIDEKSSQKQL